jgi:hypothetical protein
VCEGYTWDGATGAIDTHSIIKASCVHDIFCELINARLLPVRFQKIADILLVEKMRCYWEYLREYGTFWQRLKEYLLRPLVELRMRWIYRAVRIYQDNKRNAPQRKILEVP